MPTCIIRKAFSKPKGGGLAYDLTGSGALDIINGSDSSADELAWWEHHPGTADTPWKRHLIAKTGARQFHDEALGDVTGDGRISLVFTNQGAEGGSQLGVIPLPSDPSVSPWPELVYIAQGQRIKNQPEEGLALVDIDGDGLKSLCCCIVEIDATTNGQVSSRHVSTRLKRRADTAVHCREKSGQWRPDLISLIRRHIRKQSQKPLILKDFGLER